jgi:hypothetical protein
VKASLPQPDSRWTRATGSAAGVEERYTSIMVPEGLRVSLRERGR